MTDELRSALKALRLTSEHVLFFDARLISRRMLEQACESLNLPNGLVLVGFTGAPNVEAWTRDQLKQLLSQLPEVK